MKKKAPKEIIKSKPLGKNYLPVLNQKTKYEVIFLCPLNKCDAINSIDIYDDFILYGTIMGNAYLCRVNKNNLVYKVTKPIKNINQDSPSNKKIKEVLNITHFEDNKHKYKIEEETSKISCIKLFTNKNQSQCQLNQSIVNKDKNTGKYYYDSDVIKPGNKFDYFVDKPKLENNNIKNEFLNIAKNRRNSQNTIIDKENPCEVAEIENQSYNIPFPQVTQLVKSSNENIPCARFYNKNIVFLSIGDYEILKFEDIENFNCNDENSNYLYTRIRTYKTENEHIKKCENTTCMMTIDFFLILYTDYAEFFNPIVMNQITYENKNLKTFEIVKGEIEMFNYSVPFDFDGDRYLFIDFPSDSMRRICIYYTLSKNKPYIFRLKNDFGHISHMKFLNDDKIFLCRNLYQCEIRNIDDNFSLCEKWQHNNNEIISTDIYYKGNRISNKNFQNNNESQDEFFEMKDNDDEKIDNIILNKNKEILKMSLKIKNHKIEDDINYSGRNTVRGRNRNNIYRSPFDKNNFYENKFNNSSYRELSAGLHKLNYRNKTIEDNENSIKEYKNKNFKLNSGKISKDSMYSERKINGLSSRYYEKNKLTQGTYCNGFDDENVYIITLDVKGNLNLYQNKNTKTIFNLYNIDGIDKNYKDGELFESGFPYFITMNGIYYAISTDYGIFVVSESKG